MLDADYCREHAAHARQLADRMHQQDIQELLHRVAQEYDEIAEDIEAGVEMRHQELLPIGE
jgi:hypothetical protein